MKPYQNKDFGSRSPAKDRRDKKAEPSFNPPRLLAGSSTRILKYVEDLKRGFNAEVGPKDYFEIASYMDTIMIIKRIRCSSNFKYVFTRICFPMNTYNFKSFEFKQK